MIVQQKDDHSNDPRRRVKLLILSPDIIVRMFKNTDPVIWSFEGMPADAKCVGVQYDIRDQTIHLAIESETYPLVEEGMVLERFRVTVKEHKLSACLVEP